MFAQACHQLKAPGERFRLSRRDFLKGFGFWTAGLLLPRAAVVSGKSPAATQLFAENPFRMDDLQAAAALKFFKGNRTAGGMPLSFRLVPRDYFSRNGIKADSTEHIVEILTTTHGLNIYDAAAGQIAETILGFTDLADQHTRRLLGGRTGAPGQGLDRIRASEGFLYNGRADIAPENAFFFRNIAETYAQKLPHDTVAPAFDWKTYPTFPFPHHEDWKPITGEQAWAAIIGPLQTASFGYLGGVIPVCAPELHLALSILPAVEAMQSPLGGIYHAPKGTFGKSEWDISNENNISMCAALVMLLAALKPYKTEAGIGEKIRMIRGILYGEGKKHGGIEGFFKTYAFNKEKGIFNQGGLYNARRGDLDVTDVTAVDVQTWGIMVFGADQIDRWFGQGASFRIWQKTKMLSGYFDVQGVLRGVGYTDGHDVTSAEWGFGAVMMLRALARHYHKTFPDWAREALADSLTLRNGIESELKMTLEDGSVAYKYTNKRYYIEFGWWANPIPSLAATAWAVMTDLDFDPFVLGGRSDGPSIDALISELVHHETVSVIPGSKIERLFIRREKRCI